VTVVDYWAPWCKNCKKVAPLVDRLAQALPNIKFVKVNTMEAEDIASERGIDVLPTLQFYKAGTKIGEFKGSDAAAIEAAIRAL
jgi:thioredoxin 1